MEAKRILVVGAGFSGATVARVLAENNCLVDVIDSRNHVAGNAYDYANQHGIRIHKYGPHLFHTNNQMVFDWLSQYTEWVEYKHKVVAMMDDGSTVIFPPTKSLVDRLGIELIKQIFYYPYTKKMWAVEVDPSVLDRAPVRDDEGDLYFPNDRYQYLPKYGYTALIKNIFDHKNIQVKLSTPFTKSMENHYDHVFNSMPIDVYYDGIHGELPYRSIKFNNVDLPLARMSAHGVINFTHTGPETRIVEWKNFPEHGTTPNCTSLTYEVPCDYRDNNQERYYPVKDANGVNREIYKKYRSIPNTKVTFIGRCGLYTYLNMDQCVSHSLSVAKSYLTDSNQETSPYTPVMKFSAKNQPSL